jgi:hypothetical protein
MIPCLWCDHSFEPRRGGSRQTFCRSDCRAAYHKATRQWCERAIADGRLTIEDLRNGNPVAYTLRGCGEPPSPLPDIGSMDSAFPDPVTRFVVEVPRYTIEAFVRFHFIGSHQQDDLLVIIDALKRLGQTPSISRMA